MCANSICRHLTIVKEDKVLTIVSCGDFRGFDSTGLGEETGLWPRIA
jgi:hypothetical protein